MSLAAAVKAPVNSDRIWLAPPEQQAVEAALSAGAESLADLPSPLAEAARGLEDQRTLSGHRWSGHGQAMLGDSEDLRAGDQVVLATLHRSKGLEAPEVILAGMQESPMRFHGGTAWEKELWQRRERLLRYVGMTRARDACVVTRVGKARS